MYLHFETVNLYDKWSAPVSYTGGRCKSTSTSIPSTRDTGVCHSVCLVYSLSFLDHRVLEGNFHLQFARSIKIQDNSVYEYVMSLITLPYFPMPTIKFQCILVSPLSSHISVLNAHKLTLETCTFLNKKPKNRNRSQWCLCITRNHSKLETIDYVGSLVPRISYRISTPPAGHNSTQKYIAVHSHSVVSRTSYPNLLFMILASLRSYCSR